MVRWGDFVWGDGTIFGCLWQVPVYDRTLESPGDLYDAYERIENNTYYVKEQLENIGYSFLLSGQITTAGDEGRTDSVNNYAADIELLRKTLLPSTSDTDYPSSIGMTDYATLKHDFVGGVGGDTLGYATVNDWEKDLELLKIHADGFPLYVLQSGTFRSSGNHVLQHFMRR